jgi:hypothetical protein
MGQNATGIMAEPLPLPKEVIAAMIADLIDKLAVFMAYFRTGPKIRIHRRHDHEYSLQWLIDADHVPFC